jgi:hypothetical protein
MTTRDISRLATRGGKFLRTASTRPDVRAILVALGYSDAEHEKGWELFLKMQGYKLTNKAVPIVPTTIEQRQALLRLDAYDEGAFRRADAALTRLHPAQRDYVFGDGLKPSTGVEAVATVKTFLDRYAALRDGTEPSRAQTREADRAAAATLESRGIVDAGLEAELRKCIQTVQKLAPSLGEVVLTASSEALMVAAGEFRGWLADWGTTAASGVARRDYRILLGVANRRARSVEDSEVPDGPPEDDEE